jgi:hypothetical protein
MSAVGNDHDEAASEVLDYMVRSGLLWRLRSGGGSRRPPRSPKSPAPAATDGYRAEPAPVTRDVAPTRGAHGRCRRRCAPSPRSWALALRVQARGIPSGTARAEMALRAKAALAHPSPTKQGSATPSGGAKMALSHDRKVANLCHFPCPYLSPGSMIARPTRLSNAFFDREPRQEEQRRDCDARPRSENRLAAWARAA